MNSSLTSRPSALLRELRDSVHPTQARPAGRSRTSDDPGQQSKQLKRFDEALAMYEKNWRFLIL
jgi:hypothetical protein